MLPFNAAIEPDGSLVHQLRTAFGETSLLPSVQCVNVVGFAEALRCVGGVHILLELVSRAETTESLNKSLRLLVSCVRLNADNLVKMAVCEGYSLLSLLLQRKAHLLDMLSVRAVFDLVGICCDTPQAGALSNELALRDVLLCSNLWEQLDAKMRDSVYKMLCAAITCKYDAFTAARLTQVGAVVSLLHVLAQDSPPLSPGAVDDVTATLSFILRYHLSSADLRRMVESILAFLPGGGCHARGGGGGAAGEGGAGAPLEPASRRVHIRNTLLGMLLSQVKYLAGNANEVSADEFHRVINGRLLLEMLSRGVHSSSMVLVMQLLTYHLVAKSKYAKRFIEAGGVEELKEIMKCYCLCPHAYLLLLHSLFSTPIAQVPEIMGVDVFMFFLKPLETLDVTFPEAFAVICAMLQRCTTR